MRIVALGGNVWTATFGSPEKILEAALWMLEAEGVRSSARSAWYRTRPQPDDGQPWFVNGCVRVDTTRGPRDLLDLLLFCERRLGRVRGARNAPRTVDLDLIAYDEVVLEDADGALVLPHPRMHERPFVLVPLVEIAPAWRHPTLGRTALDLLATLPGRQDVVRMDD